jgi:hypothetical protein
MMGVLRRHTAGAVSALLFGALTGGVQAQSGQSSAYQQASGIITVSSGSADGTITQVDVPSRSVTVATSDGRTVRGSVNPSVGGLELVKVGDQVTARYEEKLVFAVAPPHVATAPDRVDSIVVTSQGNELPAGVAAFEGTRTWTIVAADPAANTVTLVGTGGGQVRTYDVTSPEGRARLKQVKPGDKLTITYVSYVFGVVERKK